jgi:ubiquinone/menaquinone biosynthesis C-methylase UbiE
VRVTGLDATPLFLELAREDAAERGVEVEYVEGDMRSIPWVGSVRPGALLVHVVRLLLGRGEPAVLAEAYERV